MTIQRDIRNAVEAVVAQHVRDRVQGVYASIQTDLGIDGSISPFGEYDRVMEAEQAFSETIAWWLVNGLSFDQAEQLGMDGTMRS